MYYNKQYVPQIKFQIFECLFHHRTKCIKVHFIFDIVDKTVHIGYTGYQLVYMDLILGIK